MALGTLGVVFAYFFRKTWGERHRARGLHAADRGARERVPRRADRRRSPITSGPSMAEGVIHQTEGFFTFGLAFALLLLEARLLAWLLAAPRGTAPSREAAA